MSGSILNLETGDTPPEKVFRYDEPGSPLETAGAWSTLVKQLHFTDEQEFIDFIEKRKVLDVGSGMGGLFKEAKYRGVEANIFNVNPRFADPEIRALDHEAFVEMLTEHTQKRPENIDEVNRQHDRATVSAFSNALPFANASFERIIDNKGAVYHALFEDDITTGILFSKFKPNEKVLSATLDEYQRLLKPGGKARIGGIHFHLEVVDECDKGMELLESLLKEKGITYRLITEDESETVAIEITKPIEDLKQIAEAS